MVALALGLHRSTLYRLRYRGVSSSVREPVIDEQLAFRIRGILDQEEAFGYRRVWAHLRFKEGARVNIKKVHRIMKLKGWQCKLWNRPGRKGPQVAQKRSVADRPDSLWSADLTRIYCGKDVCQEHIPSGKADWNGVVERFFRTLKQECVWLHNFESFEQAEKIISQWIDNYNNNRLHSSLGYKTPEEWRKQFYLLPQVA